MIAITDFQRRSLIGPVMNEQQFDMAFAKKVREVVSRYPLIKFDPEAIVVSDDIADAVFQAGADLLVEVGLYNRDTQRVIQLTKEEVNQIAQDAWNAPRQVVFGKNKDEVAIHYRTAQDPRPPVIFMNAAGDQTTEELYIPSLLSYAQEELCQGIMGFSVASSGGAENKIGTPGEVAAVFAEIKYNLEVARRAGKPDMFIGPPTGTSPVAIIACCFPGGLERQNCWIPIHLMPELKLDWSRLVLALILEERGLLPWTSSISIIGALCRGPEDAAVAQVANLLGQLGYGHGPFATTCAVNMDGSFSSLESMWSYSAAARASERHIGIPMGGPTNSLAGAGTEMALYEKAFQAVSQVSSGQAFQWYQASRLGRGQNVDTGLEGRFAGETAVAVAGMERAKANELIKKIYAKFQHQLTTPPQGKTFGELYDVKKVQPTPEYLAVYEQAKAELARLGVPYHKK